MFHEEEEQSEKLMAMSRAVQDKRRETEEEVEPYGCCCFKPRWLQFFNTIQWNVFWQCVFNFFEGFIVNGVVNVIIPALEKRYNLSSKRSAIIASSNDFGAFIFFLFIGYIGERVHKPKLMAAGVLVMSLGSFLFLLPHFIGKKYHYTLSDSNANENTTEAVCSLSRAPESEQCTGTDSDASTFVEYYAMFILGQIFHGIGAVPMFTIALTYIDENCKQKMTSLYVSLTFCSAAVGVAVGYIVGGQTLGLFVDIDKLSPNSVELTPDDPQWVGAWWIGVVISFFAFFFIVLPTLGFPKRLPGYNELQKQKVSEAYTSGNDETTTRPDFGTKLKDIPKAIWLLLKNPTYVFIILGATIELMVVGGTAVFGAKLIHVLFNVDLTTAGSVMGIITIPGSGGGMLLGGYLPKKMALRCRGIIKLCLICMSICLLFAPTFLINCSDQPLAGLNTPYAEQSSVQGLITTCNKECGCTTAAFEPICDTNHTVYFSPCHAGCTNVSTVNGVKSYFNCSCIDTPANKSAAVNGSCAEKCPWFYAFCVLLFCIMFFTFMTMSPVVTSIFRCVPDNQRSLALGIQLLVGRLLGTTPGPVLLGYIIDKSCTIWQEECGEKGSCWTYDKHDLGMRIMIWWLVLKAMGVIFFYTAYRLYKPPPTLEENQKVEIATIQCNTDREVTKL
ncbi:solute carrier organic anion transporter family member 4A1-like [Ostrea edulis]|uniref:solute carrier organic anion transporter family member 4A1-like n=1 Tax=Ostrea edulis TaxID=37623 RepID=UPI0024AF2797|nr:solute carrier organic anion transporter family member 4A1-like [Ostrea edulis]